MEVQVMPITNTQQNCTKQPNQTSVEKPNQQLTNQEKQAQVPLFFPDSFQKQFEGGVCYLKRRNNSLKINIYFHKVDEKSANSLEQLFTKQFEAQDVVFNISNDYMSQDMKDLFKKVRNLHEFLFKFIGTNKVKIDREKMHLIVSEDKQIDIFFAQEIQLYKQRNKVMIEVERIQDKLIQFSNKEMQALNSVSSILLNKPSSLNTHNSQVVVQNNNLNYLNIDFDIEQEQFLEKEESNTQEQSQEQVCQRLNRQEEKILYFQKTFAEIFNFVSKNIVISQPIFSTMPNNPPQERMIPEPTTTLPQSALFPPGYTPPHLSKPIAPDGFASDSGLKFQANQTKKQKLRMSKQMLKLGYSVDEIIHRLKEIDIAQKTGKLQHKNAYVAPSQGPVRAFHIPRQNHAPMNFPPQRNVQLQRMGNEKKVRERLIGLLKQKKYKKLEDIQKHMAGEGIQTTVEILKGMIDDIRAKNAQRKSQNQ